MENLVHARERRALERAACTRPDLITNHATSRIRNTQATAQARHRSQIAVTTLMKDRQFPERIVRSAPVAVPTAILTHRCDEPVAGIGSGAETRAGYQTKIEGLLLLNRAAPSCRCMNRVSQQRNPMEILQRSRRQSMASLPFTHS